MTPPPCQAFEFGCSDDDMERSSVKASLVSGGLFILGSLPAVIPFACTNVRNDAVIAASVCCCAMLFFVGAAKTKMTRTNLWVGGFENMFYGAAGAAGFAFSFSRSLVPFENTHSSFCSVLRNWSAIRLRCTVSQVMGA